MIQRIPYTMITLLFIQIALLAWVIAAPAHHHYIVFSSILADLTILSTCSILTILYVGWKLHTAISTTHIHTIETPMTYSMFLDDIRDSRHISDVVVRSSLEAIDMVKARGIPHYISFDHDLGGNDTAIVFIQWLTDHMLDHHTHLPNGFRYGVHSANPVGRENIDGKMKAICTHFAAPAQSSP